ncbi:hypothetical protein RB2654_18768 [Maritimibacter alkaliphilus HTCC2654]|uniref:Uncharacterized protein n=1 Tax=Maritimibacter alkaliphilus HTCC2654 TaxID=314271 RepID=A3V9R4_9RHOB|nr:hypothetical protein RB2654_18768 [Maritimibacter alkaliphilus HTCC2654]
MTSFIQHIVFALTAGGVSAPRPVRARSVGAVRG